MIVINDKYIIDKFSDKNGKISPTKFKKLITKDDKTYIQNRYPLDEYIGDLFNLKRLFYNINELPRCEYCNNKIYKISARWCNQSCQMNDPKFKEYRNNIIDKDKQKQHFKETCLHKFGETTPLKNVDIKKKIEKTCLEKYGVKHITQSNIIKNKIKETCLEKYGVVNGGCSKEALNKIYKTNQIKYGVNYSFQRKDVKRKCKETCQSKYKSNYYINSKDYYKKCLDKYGVKYISQSKEIQEKIKHTCFEKYGVYNPSKLDKFKHKIKETCLEKYGVENVSQLKEVQEKVLKTKKKNHTFNTSKIEDQAYDILVSKFGKDDVIRQYKSTVYPYSCDFYILSKDLYIEIQGSWTHGGHPYDKDSKEDNIILEKWKSKDTQYHNNAIQTWTIRDVTKRNIAKKNNLNYIEIWNIQDLVENILSI